MVGVDLINYQNPVRNTTRITNVVHARLQSVMKELSDGWSREIETVHKKLWSELLSAKQGFF